MNRNHCEVTNIVNYVFIPRHLPAVAGTPAVAASSCCGVAPRSTAPTCRWCHLVSAGRSSRGTTDTCGGSWDRRWLDAPGRTVRSAGGGNWGLWASRGLSTEKHKSDVVQFIKIHYFLTIFKFCTQKVCPKLNKTRLDLFVTVDTR